ncbi:DUF2586 domain-containing protein [Serratia sp. S1B]|nr:DUF2586 domain-containing protein [Serratia sp. S1B]
MTWPNVTINQLNQRQGIINEIERTVLFIGHAAAEADTPGDLIMLNSQSDIDVELKDACDLFRKNLLTAQLNAGQNWQAYALLVPANANTTAKAEAIRNVQQMISVEGVVSIGETDANATAAEIGIFSALREELIAKLGRWLWFMLAVPGPIDGREPKTWAAYVEQLAQYATGKAAHAVQLVPALWGNEVGALAGRLCQRSVTIADSPARVKTGSLIGLDSDLPVDADGIELNLAHLRTLHDLRYSVPMWYADYEGVYWSDGLTLDVKGGDYPVIEYLRIVDKAARRVRIQAIAKIGDRSLNSTPGSIAAHKTYFSRTMREMSRSAQINGVTFPGEVKPPRDGDVEIYWSDANTVSIYLIVRPYESPKSITVSIMLDTSLEV